MELLTAAQMRAIEQAAIDSGEVTGLELMERAGRGVVEAIFEWRPELAASPGRAVVLCGPGNNGGDGFVVARLLKGQGWDVEVFLYGDEAKLPPDAAENCRRWREMGEVQAWNNFNPLEALHGGNYKLTIDGVFGTGLSRPMMEPLIEFARMRGELDKAHHQEYLVSIDVPSGLESDSGRVLGEAFSADLCIAFHRRKRGHILADGPAKSGACVTVDIGLEEFHWPALLDLYGLKSRRGSGKFGLGEFEAYADLVAKEADHKFTHGHTLVLSGGVGKGGAARLSARAALRIGAGLVTVGTPPSALIENAAQLNAIMLARIEGAEGLAEVLQDERINSVVIGPGLGVSDKTHEMILIALKSAKRSVVLDADALTVFQDEPAALFAATKDKKVVLTPHMGEFGRLFPDIAKTLSTLATKGPAYSKVDAARDAASRAGCTVLLKGPDTVVASPDGAASVVSAAYERACPWLATAGSGDVLAGFIGGLMARGLSPKTAAETGAWLHQECAREFGPGLIAEDLPETLPKVFRNLGL